MKADGKLVLHQTGGQGELKLSGSVKGKGLIIGEVDSEILMVGNLKHERDAANTPFGASMADVSNRGDLVVSIKNNVGTGKEYTLKMNHKVEDKRTYAGKRYHIQAITTKSSTIVYHYYFKLQNLFLFTTGK